MKNQILPASIRAILDLNLNNYQFEKAEVAETALGKSYEFEIEAGGKEYDVIIDALGKFTIK